MPSIVRDTSSVKQRSFAPYEGPEPTRGFYRSCIKKAVIQKAKSTDSLMIHLVTEFEASPTRPESARYNGYPAFVYLTLGDKEPLLEREQAFYLAVTGKEKANIKTEGDANKLKRGESTKILTIDGKNPVGAYVLTELRNEDDNREGHQGESRLRADGVYPTRDQNDYAGKQVAGQTSAVDDEEEDDTDEGEEVTDYTEDDLKGKSLAELRRILSEEFDIDPAGIKGKANLVSEILDAQTDSDDEEDEDLEDDEDDLEEDEDDEEDDLEARIDEEIAPLDRNGLKTALKKRQPDRKFKTSETDEMLRGELRELMLQDPPF